eukprot:9472908-Pyramimonas_sp.AAC.1
MSERCQAGAAAARRGTRLPVRPQPPAPRGPGAGAAAPALPPRPDARGGGRHGGGPRWPAAVAQDR